MEPTKTPVYGYEFDSWSTAIPTVYPDTNLTIIGSWKENDAERTTVTFENGDATKGKGTITGTLTFRGIIGSSTPAITAPDTTPATGYNFSGWTAEIPTAYPDADLTVIARWTAKEDVNYTVRYLEAMTDVKLATDELVSGKIFDETYTETAKAITGYTPDATTKTITLDAYGKVLTFHYSLEPVAYLNSFAMTGRLNASGTYATGFDIVITGNQSINDVTVVFELVNIPNSGSVTVAPNTRIRAVNSRLGTVLSGNNGTGHIDDLDINES